MSLERVKSAADRKTIARGDAQEAIGVLFRSTQHLSTRGLAPGVIFFLRGLIETTIVMALIFAAQMPLMQDIMLRTMLRDECRISFVEGQRVPPGCGYEHVHVLQDIMPIVGLARYAYNSCEEFADDGAWYGFDSTVDTIDASYCASGGFTMMSLLYWYADLLLLLLLLWRLMHLEAQVEQEADDHVWTTADYSIMLHGLDIGVEIHQAVRAIAADLASLGFDRSKVHHIEVGLRAPPSVKASQVESSQVKQHMEAGVPGPPAVAEGGSSGGTVEERTTGHAFVVLRMEEWRNELLHTSQLLFPRAAAQAHGMGVKVRVGPEPSNVLWENLEVPTCRTMIEPMHMHAVDMRPMNVHALGVLHAHDHVPWESPEAPDVDRTHQPWAPCDPDAPRPWALCNPHAHQPWALCGQCLAGAAGRAPRALVADSASDHLRPRRLECRPHRHTVRQAHVHVRPGCRRGRLLATAARPVGADRAHCRADDRHPCVEGAQHHPRLPRARRPRDARRV